MCVKTRQTTHGYASIAGPPWCKPHFVIIQIVMKHHAQCMFNMDKLNQQTRESQRESLLSNTRIETLSMTQLRFEGGAALWSIAQVLRILTMKSLRLGQASRRNKAYLIKMETAKITITQYIIIYINLYTIFAPFITFGKQTWILKITMLVFQMVYMKDETAGPHKKKCATGFQTYLTLVHKPTKQPILFCFGSHNLSKWHRQPITVYIYIILCITMCHKTIIWIMTSDHKPQTIWPLCSFHGIWIWTTALPKW